LNASITVENKTVIIAQSGAGQSSDLGGVDPLTCSGTVTGWVADLSRPSTSLSVWIYDGTNYYGPIIANIPRTDISVLLGDNHSHGFFFQLPGNLAGTTKTIHVYSDDVKTDLAGSPTSVTCGGANYAGYVDSASCSGITGWAADRNRLSTPITVTLWDGATQVVSALANGSRGDVGALLGDNGLHAFSIPIPASYANGVSHPLQIRYETSAMQLPASPVTLTCGGSNTPPNYAGYVDSASCSGITGWGADRNRPNVPITVTLWDGATQLASVLANGSRGDVARFSATTACTGIPSRFPQGMRTA